MSVPFFNENPLLQFEQNNIINNYLEIDNERNLSIFSNPELENKWVFILVFFSHLISWLYQKRKRIRQNFNANYISLLNHSWKFNFLKFLMTFCKAGGIIYILQVPEDCHGPFYLWLLLCLFHDVLKLFLIIRRLGTLVTSRCQMMRQSEQESESSVNQGSSMQLMDLESYIRNVESQRSTLSSEKIRDDQFHLWSRIFKVLEEFCKMY